MPDGADAGQPPAGMPAAVGDELARGRAASQQLRWAEAYQSLAAAERSTTLAGQDAELLATAAFCWAGWRSACRRCSGHSRRMPRPATRGAPPGACSGSASHCS